MKVWWPTHPIRATPQNQEQKENFAGRTACVKRQNFNKRLECAPTVCPAHFRDARHSGHARKKRGGNYGRSSPTTTLWRSEEKTKSRPASRPSRPRFRHRPRGSSGVPRPTIGVRVILDRPAYWPRGTPALLPAYSVADDSSRPETFRGPAVIGHLVSCPDFECARNHRATTLLRIAPVIGAGMVSPQTKRGMT